MTVTGNVSHKNHDLEKRKVKCFFRKKQKSACHLNKKCPWLF